MPWLVRSVRFTSFLMPEVAVPSGTWAAVLGGEPENTTQNRPAGLRQETGPFLDGLANVTVQPGRVDCVFMPVETLAPDLATLGNFPGATDQYLEAVSHWVQSDRFPMARRLALGLVLVESTETRETGYERLRHFIDSVPQGEAADFLYQVNRYRPTVTGVPDLKINRLAKWSVSQLRMITLDAGGGAPALAPPLSFVNLELDVNTSAEFAGPIPQARAGAILDDLRAGATEIATHGDHV